MITLKEKLKAIRGSIDKWDKISKGEMEDMGPKNCPLCHLSEKHTKEGNLLCDNCPIKIKTGVELCRGTPYQDYLMSEDYASSKQEYVAGVFRDWLKDLYIEVSEEARNG